MWTWEQSTGFAYHNGIHLFTGYAGNGSGKNNPDAQQLSDIGPLPCGKYLMLEPEDTALHGPYVIWLRPDPANRMYGRFAFGIHGERIEPPPGEASDGCIILALAERQYMWNTLDHDLEVVASLPQ